MRRTHASGAQTAAAVLEIAGLAAIIGITIMMPFVQPARAAQEDVFAVDYKFLPQTITINTGDTVLWTNNVSTPHTVTSDTGAWLQIDLPTAGSTGSFKFDIPGTYDYHCVYHVADGMVGTVIVTGTAVPEFSGGLFVVIGLMAMMFGLMAARRRHT